MSTLLDAFNSVRDMSVANKGTGSTAQPTIAGFGGSVNQAGYSDSYGTDDSPYGGDTGKKALTSGNVLNKTNFPTGGMTTEQQIRSYTGLGVTAASTGSLILKAAGSYFNSPTFTNAGSTLGKTAGGMGLALTAYDIAKTGKVTGQQALNIGTTVGPAAIGAVNAVTGLGIGANTIGLGAGTVSGAGSATAAGAGAGTAAGAYAAAAIAAREGLSAILSNQTHKVAALQGQLMKEPTLEGLSHAAATEVARGVFHTSPERLAQLENINKPMDPVGTLMKGQWDTDTTTSILTGGLSNIGEIAGLWGGGLTEGEVRDQQARAYAEALQNFAKANPNYTFSSKDVPFDFSLAYGKMYGDVLNMPENNGLGTTFNGPNLDTYKGKTTAEIEAMSRLTDEDITKMLREGTFTTYINKIQQLQQQSSYAFGQEMMKNSYGLGG